jgi:hypothetical protein
MNGGEFMCHTKDYKCADKPCAGFLMAKLAADEQDRIDAETVKVIQL